MASPVNNIKYDVDSTTINYTTLKIELEATGDVTTKIDLIPFHPNMADLKDLSNNNYILFNDHVKITMNDLKNASNKYPTILGNNFPKIFTTFTKYKKLIEYVSNEKEHIPDDTLLINSSQRSDYPKYFSQTSLDEDDEDVKSITKKGILSDNEIIINNLELIRQLFLPVKGRFFIFGREYVIRKSKYKPKYDSSASLTKTNNDGDKKPHLYFNVIFKVDLIDATENPELGNFSRLNCKEKKKGLMADINALFGINVDFFQAQPAQAALPGADKQTTTKNRGFTKVQTDWEEKNRNRSNNPQDKVSASIQDKKYEEVNEEYLKIPEGWRKEMDEVDINILNLVDAINKRLKEIEDLKIKSSDNAFVKKQIDILKKEIYDMLENKQRAEVDKIFTNKKITKETLKFFEDEKEKIINEKYTRKIVEELVIKQNEINTLKQEESALYETLKKDPNNIEARQNLTRIQADLLKKQPPLELLERKYGAKGEKIIIRWNTARNKMLELKNSLKKKRTDEEAKISSATINTELAEKMKEIDRVEKDILLKQFTMGQFMDMTKSEKDEYTKTNEKETIQQPSDSLETLKGQLKTLKDEYLEIADQFERFNQSIVEKNKLVQRDFNRIKALKTSIQSSNQNKQTKIADSQKKEREIDSTISQILSRIKEYERGDKVKNAEAIKDEEAKITSYKEQLREEKEERAKITLDMAEDKKIQSDLEVKEKWYDAYIKMTTKNNSKDFDEPTKLELMNFNKQIFDYLIDKFDDIPDTELKQIVILNAFVTTVSDKERIKAKIDAFKSSKLTLASIQNLSQPLTVKVGGGGSNKKPIYTRRKYKNMMYHRQTRRL
jgi:hypothetical protein